MDFGFQSLGTTVETNAVCADGYEPNNLIANNPKGFRVEYFVRPPIELTFTFSFPIDIRSVVCGLRCGEQKTDAFQVYLGDSNDQLQFCGFFESGKDEICLINSNYRCNNSSDFKLPSKAVSNADSQASEMFYVSRRFNMYFRRTKKLQLRLVKAHRSCICCLKYVRIIGQPNRVVLKDANVNRLVNSSLTLPSIPNRTIVTETHTSVKTAEESAHPSIETTVDVPEEFIDPLTSEMMTFPLILPSGNTIDKSTLDKYLKNESSWGRLPNDPFTNKCFTKNSHPLPNDALKLRIDHFLSLNHETMSMDKLPKSRIVAGYSNTSKLVDDVNLSVVNAVVDKTCVICGVIHDLRETVYRLPCTHLICRKWLADIESQQKTCSRCKVHFQSRQVVRYFHN